MKIHVFPFVSHVEGYSCILRHVLLLSSHIWRQGCTCSRHSPFGTLIYIFSCIFLHWKVPLGCLHSFQGKSYIFEGISHHLGSSHITQGISTYVEA
jgi:hypothetical protein